LFSAMFWVVQMIGSHLVRLQQAPAQTIAAVKGDTRNSNTQGAIEDLLDMVVVSREVVRCRS
jgi:hypothetical protein